MEINRIVHSDCVVYMNQVMEPKSGDLMVTSPLYDNLRDYNGYSFDYRAIAEGFYRVTKKVDVLCVQFELLLSSSNSLIVNIS